MAIALTALAARLLVGHGLVNYDTLYALVWGRDVGLGHLPDYAVAVAPTPHPLAIALSAVLTPLSTASHHGVHGETATDVVLGGAFASLAALGWVVFALGRTWFNPVCGLLAALIVLTRQPVLDYGARAYVDIPYAALVLGALLVETRRPRAGLSVLALLTVAGLLRPEAWLFSGVYWVWLWWPGRRGERLGLNRELVAAGALAALAPVLWLGADLAVTGDALHSLTGTRTTARTLHRLTGLANVPIGTPRRLGEIVREPVLLGAAAGLGLAVAWLRHRAATAVVALALSLLAFTVLAAAGLSILTRYLLVPGCLLALLCAGAVGGWLELAPGEHRRRWWAWTGGAVALVLIAFIPAQVHRIRALRHTLATQGRIQDDLAGLVRRGALGRGCLPVDVPNHRPVPVLALWLDTRPGAIVSAQDSSLSRGSYVLPASAAAAGAYILDPRDPVRAIAAAPRGFAARGGDRSWKIYARCP